MVLMHRDIPEELLVKIFIVQPAKSLLRLRSVCKLWYKVISSDFFVKSHLACQKTSSNKNKYFLIRHPPYYFTTLVDDESYNNVLESNKNNIREILGKYPPNVRLECYGICEGLLCWSHAKHDLYLWNPIVRKVKKLPRIKKSHIWDFDPSYVCFGHHDDDYKVINVVPLHRVYKVHIYSLSQDSWNLLEFNKESNDTNRFDIWPSVKARFVNGAAYFVQRGEKLVMCFDLSCKIIRRINLPCNFSFDNYFMDEYQDSIALLENKRDHVVFWGLKVSDNSYRWNKLTIKPQTTAIGAAVGTATRAMGFVNKDKVVLRLSTLHSGHRCFLFNLENKSEPPLTILTRYLQKVDKRGIGGVRLYDLMESLVLLAKATTCEKMQPCSANEENQESRKRKSFCY